MADDAGVVDVATLDGDQGFTIQLQYLATSQVVVSSAGDVNGDGFDDFIIGVPKTFGFGTINQGYGFFEFRSHGRA
jgi:hypothetical protein